MAHTVHVTGTASGTNGTDGATYVSLAAAIAGEVAAAADLSAGGGGIRGICCHDIDEVVEDGVAVGGFTNASAANYVHIYGNPDDKSSSTTGKWSTSRYTLSLASTVDAVLTVATPFTRLTDLQVVNTSASGGAFGFLCFSASITIARCLAYCTGTAAANGFESGNPESGTHHFINCIAVGAWSQGFNLSATDPGAVKAYSCTAYGCAVGFKSQSGGSHAKNCVAVGCTDAFLINDDFAAADGNAYDEGTSTGVGTNSLDVSSYTDDQLFVDADNATVLSKDLHLAAGSALIGAGVDTSGESAPLNFTDDIDGTTRNDWDIGADEYVAGGDPTVGWYTITG